RHQRPNWPAPADAAARREWRRRGAQRWSSNSFGPGPKPSQPSAHQHAEEVRTDEIAARSDPVPPRTPPANDQGLRYEPRRPRHIQKYSQTPNNAAVTALTSADTPASAISIYGCSNDGSIRRDPENVEVVRSARHRGDRRAGDGCARRHNVRRGVVTPALTRRAGPPLRSDRTTVSRPKQFQAKRIAGNHIQCRRRGGPQVRPCLIGQEMAGDVVPH